jgi:hypothetical protein
VQLLAERIDVAGGIQNQEDQDGDCDQNENPNPNLA